MGDNSAAVGDEVFCVHGSLGFLGLETQDLKVGDAGIVDWADRRTPAAAQLATIQRQTVEGICSVTTVKGCMDGLHRLFHLIGGSVLLGPLRVRHRCAVQQPLVALSIDGHPGGGQDIHQIDSKFNPRPRQHFGEGIILDDCYWIFPRWLEINQLDD